MKEVKLSTSAIRKYCDTACDYIPYLVRQLRESSDLTSVAAAHAKFLKSGSMAISTGNHFINAYLRFGELDHARKLFEEMAETNVVSWTSLMAGCIDGGRPDRAIWLFNEMSSRGIEPNSFTFATAINACAQLANLRTGRMVHARVETTGLHLDLVVSTALVNMYGKSAGDITDARRVFNRMLHRNIISWGSMISAYAQNACGHEAIALFSKFLRESSLLELRPNHFMLSSIINACASVGRLGLGKSVHAAVIHYGYECNDVIAGALTDMYAKCGCIDFASKVFNRIEQPSLVPYTSMIVAAAKYGQGKYSLNLFEEMIVRGVKPNSVTLLGVLHACSHSGLVDAGLQYLNSMHKDYGITPSARHYTCAVDMLGRAGRLDEAYKLSKDFQAEGEDALMLWSTLLSASRTHRRLDLAFEAGKRLEEFERDVAGAYVAMSNTYESDGQWKNVERIRAEMRRRGIRKEPGCSWVEVKDVAYVFYAGGVSLCARAREVVAVLRELEVRMEERGYVGRRKESVFDGVEEEGEVGMVGVHSERLALGFALISIPKGVTIRVMKNLRICRDCHEAFKLISDIVERDIVVRDLNRFHHFRNGSCTCKDYW